MGRLLITVGGVLIVVGLVVLSLERLGVGIGRLPGDFVWRGKRAMVYAPLGTSLLLSLLLSLLVYAQPLQALNGLYFLQSASL